ncbi:uncharacterized protein HD556DRAFT_530833 [Suillus plorans]|uniref:Uncharacterized protein n=1 Tax=Suillus plorans TaxID=116603 RepID=A0A9P7AN96_9AGAM|nr:uncharacterized protein HD556DRAFT_530833 [Suillus plorans]KAG1792955.1 hypothetical protein HD556DRAFT_530833 [Suillus plorans]
MHESGSVLCDMNVVSFALWNLFWLVSMQDQSLSLIGVLWESAVRVASSVTVLDVFGCLLSLNHVIRNSRTTLRATTPWQWRLLSRNLPSPLLQRDSVRSSLFED